MSTPKRQCTPASPVLPPMPALVPLPGAEPFAPMPALVPLPGAGAEPRQDQAKCLQALANSGAAKLLEITVEVLLRSATRHTALASLASSIGAFNADFEKCRGGTSGTSLEAYMMMTPEELGALPQWEKLYACSFRRFAKMVGRMTQLHRRLSAPAADGWSLEQRCRAFVSGLGKWLGHQDEQHKALPQDQRRLNNALMTFAAGFATLAEGLRPHASPAAPTEALPEWAADYRRLEERFQQMRDSLQARAAVAAP
jgi:hypothetical protein